MGIMGTTKGTTTDTQLTIGQVARRTGVGIEAIRFYERRRLLPKPARNPSGYRQYTQTTLARLHFISRAKALGFTLDEIQELLALRVRPQGSCQRVKTQTEAKLAQVSAKIRDLQKIKRVLQRFVATCDANAPSAECPILDALDNEAVEDL